MYPSFTIMNPLCGLYALCTLAFWVKSQDLLSSMVGAIFACWFWGSWQEQLSNCWMIPGLICLKSSLEMGECLFCRNMFTNCPAEKQVCKRQNMHCYQPQQWTKFTINYHPRRIRTKLEGFKSTHEAITMCVSLQPSDHT